MMEIYTLFVGLIEMGGYISPMKDDNFLLVIIGSDHAGES